MMNTNSGCRMNFEELLIFGALTIIAGGVLYLPFYIWKRWQGKKALPSGGPLSARITRRGITFYGVMVVFLFVGFAQEHLAPKTGFGVFLSTWSGRIIYMVCVLTLFTVLEMAFAMVGVKFSERSDKDV